MQQQTVIINQPTGPYDKGLLIGSIGGHRDWTSGLFGCFNDFCGIIKACCCMDCLICNLNSRAGECACVHYLVPGALINLRTRVRTLGGIHGTMMNDCLAMTFCPFCAVCQIEREMDAMGL